MRFVYAPYAFVSLQFALACIHAFGDVPRAAPDVVFRRGAPAHIVATPATPLEQRVCDRLAWYMSEVLGVKTLVESSLEDVPAGVPVVVLGRNSVAVDGALKAEGEHEEAFALSTTVQGSRQIAVCVGNTELGLKRAVQRLIIESKQEPDALVLPGCLKQESPWIPHREWTACPWVPEFVGGRFCNHRADKRYDVFSYSKERIREYVEMFDWFGFSGCQLMETCYTYSVFGSIEAAHEWQLQVASAAKENGQDVSLWAWCAEFSGFGWVEPEAVYQGRDGMSAFEDPQVRRVFEKYYDAYAELAPSVDRFFGHFYDPGQLDDREDVFAYMRLLENKLKAKNENIQMGIDSWAAGPEYVGELVDNGFGDYLLLTNTVPFAYGPNQLEEIHQRAKQADVDMGIWGWYTTEMETIQLASMFVNARLLKTMYTKFQEGPLSIHPVTYWSEMEAHHLNNIYSMYAAAQLQWDLERDPDQILEELALGLWGPSNGPKALEALMLIQDVRTGSTWGKYWWTSPDYHLGTEDPAEDKRRAAACVAALSNWKPDENYVCKFPLPFKPDEFIELMLPHLMQIEHYAQFRLDVAAFNEAAAKGASKEALEIMLRELWKPVLEYDTWVGTFGIPENRMQKLMVKQLREKHNLAAPDPGWFRYLEADRLLNHLRHMQRGRRRPLSFSVKAADEFFWPPSYPADRVQKLLDDGAVVPVEDGMFKLADWENWSY